MKYEKAGVICNFGVGVVDVEDVDNTNTKHGVETQFIGVNTLDQCRTVYQSRSGLTRVVSYMPVGHEIIYRFDAALEVLEARRQNNEKTGDINLSLESKHMVTSPTFRYVSIEVSDYCFCAAAWQTFRYTGDKTKVDDLPARLFRADKMARISSFRTARERDYHRGQYYVLTNEIESPRNIEFESLELLADGRLYFSSEDPVEGWQKVAIETVAKSGVLLVDWRQA